MSLHAFSKIGIIGSGAMGTGIAQVAATAGHEVIIFDQNPEALNLSSARLLKILNRLAEKERITNEEAVAIFGRVFYVTSQAAYEECDLVIEAIIEEMKVKEEVFQNLEIHTRKDTILATNTSSLPVTAIAASCTDPSRVMGIHFFNPAPLMKLVEIIPAVQSDPAIVEESRKLIESWGKTTVLVQDTPGFIVNRIARPYYSEALRIMEEGIADAATIDRAMKEVGGFKMGPFELMDFIGHDVNFRVTQSMYEAHFHEPRYKPSFSQQRLIHAGYLGKKSGKGFYTYGTGVEREQGSANHSMLAYICQRVLCMLINEAADALFWKVASRDEIDIAMTRGVNYPKGLLAWADEIGINEVTDTLDALYDHYHEERYRCSPLLRKMLSENQTFY